MKGDPAPASDAKSRTGLSSFDLGPLGIIKLDSIRGTALRAGRLAEALFGAPEADVVAIQAGRIWRGKSSRAHTDDAAARLLIAKADHSLWISDTLNDPTWRGSPQVQDPAGVRFCALAPIRMRDGALLGALRVFDTKPRAFDPALAARLEDLAESVADECDRLLGGEVRRMRELFDQAPGFMAIVTGPDHVFELVNAAYLEVVGHRDLIGRPLREAIPEVESQGFNALLANVYATGQPYVARAAEVLLHRQPGCPLETVFIDFVYQPIRDPDGSVSGVFVQGSDVTREKLSADDLAASRRDLETALSVTETILDQSLDVISTIDASGIFKTVSQQAEQLWGYRPHELVGRSYLDLVHPDDLAATRAIGLDIMAGRATTAFSNRYMHKDGAVVPVMWSAVWSETHKQVFAVARDMRQREAAESMLRQAQKMEAVGQLTGGVAHDFNNLLTVVIGSAETLFERLVGQPDLQEMAQLVTDAAQRGADLVSRLLAYSRKQPLAAQSIDCRMFLEGLLPMLARTLGEDIDVVVTADEDLFCLADPTQLTSALLNLCLNGRDAMPGGGSLAIDARRAPRDTPLRGDADKKPSFVIVSVRDTGEGMDEEVVARILEPFFTTKPPGLGSGLGLSMVYGFANQSGGSLTIESTPARGTCVSIYLPQTSPAATMETPAPQTSPAATMETPASPPSGSLEGAGGRHILLVEDDDLVRRQTQSHLAILGYRVSSFANGRDALQRLSGIHDIDLILTDIVMPGGMNGRELAEQARELIPNVQVVFTSGYSSDAIRRSQPPDMRAQFLSKPYRRADLARVLQLAFDDVGALESARRGMRHD